MSQHGVNLQANSRGSTKKPPKIISWVSEVNRHNVRGSAGKHRTTGLDGTSVRGFEADRCCRRRSVTPTLGGPNVQTFLFEPRVQWRQQRTNSHLCRDPHSDFSSEVSKSSCTENFAPVLRIGLMKTSCRGNDFTGTNTFKSHSIRKKGHLKMKHSGHMTKCPLRNSSRSQDFFL